MGHTKAENLKDLRAELKAIEALDGVKQKAAGIFYWKSQSFLHFHDKDGKRWADVKKVDGSWQSVEIDFGASPAQKIEFLKNARDAHQRLQAKK